LVVRMRVEMPELCPEWASVLVVFVSLGWEFYRCAHIIIIIITVKSFNDLIFWNCVLAVNG
jgi:hypothetical protein